MQVDRPETPIDPNALRDEDDHLRPEWIERLQRYIASLRPDAVAEMIAPLHAADIGDVLEALDRDERVALINMLGDKFDYSALTEVDEAVRSELMDLIPNADIARGMVGLDSDDAVYILEDIDVPDREDILSQMPAFERLSLKRSLDFPEDSAGRLMQTDFIAIPPFWTVGQTIDYLRDEISLDGQYRDPDRRSQFHPHRQHEPQRCAAVLQRHVLLHLMRLRFGRQKAGCKPCFFL